MKKSFILASVVAISTFAMADFVAVISSNGNLNIGLSPLPPTIPDNIIRCNSGEGVNRGELIALIDSGADVTNVCTSNITDFSKLFHYGRSGANSSVTENFNQDIGDWDVSNGVNFEKMFERARRFNQDIGDWEMSNATNMTRMFYQANDFNKDIGKWDVSKNTDFLAFFHEAYSFNQDISKWNVSSGVTFSSMFSMAYAFDQNIGGWNVSSGQDFSYMFYATNSFDNDVHLWDVENATTFTNFKMGSTPLRTDYIPCKFGGNCTLDTDGDAVLDHDEVYNDTDPLDPNSK